jgi:hypothetical protein
MKASKSVQYLGQEFFVGAGSWYAARDLGKNNLYQRTFKKFMKALQTGIDSEFALQYCEDMDAAARLDEFKEARQELVECLSSSKVLSTKDSDVSMLHLNKKYRVVQPYETSSHVVHVPFDPLSTQHLVHRIQTMTWPYSTIKRE